MKTLIHDSATPAIRGATGTKSILQRLLLPGAALVVFLLTPVVSLISQPFLSGELRRVSVEGQADAESGESSFVIKGLLKPHGPADQEPLVYTLELDGKASISSDATRIRETWMFTFKRLRGHWEEISLQLSNSKGTLLVQVDPSSPFTAVVETGESGSGHHLILVPGAEAEDSEEVALTISLDRKSVDPFKVFTPVFASVPEALGIGGKLRVETEGQLRLSFAGTGASLISDSAGTGDGNGKVLEATVQGRDYQSEIAVAPDKPDLFANTFRDFSLESELDDKDGIVKMALSGVVDIRHPGGGQVPVLGGEVGVVSYSLSDTSARMIFEDGQFLIASDRPCSVEVTVRFHCRLRDAVDGRSINIMVADSIIRPVALHGWAEDSSFQITPLGDIEWDGDSARGYLQPSGSFRLTWTEQVPELSGRVFYSVKGLLQSSLGSGRLSQVFWLDYQIMQGEVDDLVLDVAGPGEILRVDGEDILSWKILPTEDGADGARRLEIRMRRPVTGVHRLKVYTQQTLPALPLKVEPLRLAPRDALAFGGFARIVNQGAVKLEIQDSRNLTQISPERFPEMAGFPAADGSQVFAYRFSGADYDYAVQADTILPEVAASRVTIHSLGRNLQSIDCMMELDIREAPVREFEWILPSEYVLTSIDGNRIADYFLSDSEPAGQRLRVIFSEPVSGRWTGRIELSRNLAMPSGTWSLPVIQPVGVKSSRGHVGIAVEQGLRVATASSSGVTEVAAAFFPRKVDGLALAYRLRDLDWSLEVSIDEIEQSIQVDTLQLYSLGEGMVYGSSLLNYLVSGSPVDSFIVTAPSDYSNMEFSGKGVRNWKRTDDGYQVYLENPVFGTYSLLATYDMKLDPQRTTYPFEGIHPAQARNNQGYAIFISNFQVETLVVSGSEPAGVVAIQPAEIPSEYRLLFDAPLVDAYQYSSHPFELDLGVKQMERGSSLLILADRAEVTTEVGTDGQTIHTASYFIKNKGIPHIRYRLPEGLDLWEVRVDEEVVVPVSDGDSILVPLKVKANPNEVIPIRLRMAARNEASNRMEIRLPQIGSPALVTRWTIRASDEGKSLRFRSSDTGLEPIDPWTPVRGYDVFTKPSLMGRDSFMCLVAGLALIASSVVFFGVFAHLRSRFRFWSWVPVKSLSTIGLILASLSFIAGAVTAVPDAGRNSDSARELQFTIPVQSAGMEQHVSLSVAKAPNAPVSCPAVIFLVMGLIAMGVAAAAKDRGPVRHMCALTVGWGFLLAGALTQFHGFPVFLVLLAVLTVRRILLPLIFSLGGGSGPASPSRPDADPDPSPSGTGTGVPASTALIIAAGFVFTFSAGQAGAQSQSVNAVQAEQIVQQQSAAPFQSRRPQPQRVDVHGVEQITQELTFRDGFVSSSMEIHWRAEANDVLQILGPDSVLQSIHFNAREGIRLLDATAGSAGTNVLAEESGNFRISVKFKAAIVVDGRTSSVKLETPAAISHVLTADFGNRDLELSRDNLISLDRLEGGSFRYRAVLQPSVNPVLSWQPRSRDTRNEQTVYFAELTHRFSPAAGVVDGQHVAIIRPVQGQVKQLIFKVHPSLTIIDVPGENILSWRYDPDLGNLNVQLKEPRTEVFPLSFLSQSGAGALPYSHVIGLVHLPGASGELGYVGVAAPQEVQLDAVTPAGMTPLSLEDFSMPVAEDSGSDGLTLRRAYQYATAGGTIALEVSPVQPDVRVETRQTLSLGEDRTLLAVSAAFSITRSGIFQIRFPLPPGLEIESLSGSQVSHWTESEVDDQTLITVHLRSRTIGDTQLQLNLVGQGQLAGDALQAPVVQFNEATKQTGQLIVAPELGVRLYPENIDGVIQREAAAAGVRQKGALVFSLLQKQWQLFFSVEKVNPWVQTRMLQKVTLREGLAKTEARILVSIENAGVDSMRLELPADAESVEIVGNQVVDAARVPSADTEAAPVSWEVRFERKLVGSTVLSVRFQQPVSATAGEWTFQLVQVPGANLSRSWVAFQSEGRIRVESVDDSGGFQAADWSTIPAGLREGSGSTSGFVRVLRQLTDSGSIVLQIERNEIEEVLPARILKTRLRSVVALGGQMLTMVELTMDPGEERQITMQLPEGAEFWLGYINDKSVWPWKDGRNLLLPIERNAGESDESVFRFLYFSRLSESGLEDGKFDLEGPSFGLPLEDLEWQLAFPESVRLIKGKGNMDLVEEDHEGSLGRPKLSLMEVDDYLASNRMIIEEQSNSAVEYLNLGNQFMISGDNSRAQLAYENAMNFSQADQSFNEDVRVQFQNFRSQQATVALNARINSVFNKKDAAGLPADYSNLTQAQIEEILVSASEEDREAMSRLAARLVRQQEAAVARPAAIYATFPQMAHVQTLRKSHIVDTMEPLAVELELDRTRSGFSWKPAVAALGSSLAGIVLLVLVIAAIARSVSKLGTA